MLPIKRTASDCDDSSQNSLNAADSFFAKYKTPDREPNQGKEALFQKKIQKLPSLTTICSLQASPLVGSDLNKTQSIFSGASLGATSSLSLN